MYVLELTLWQMRMDESCKAMLENSLGGFCDRAGELTKPFVMRGRRIKGGEGSKEKEMELTDHVLWDTEDVTHRAWLVTTQGVEGFKD